MYGQRGATLQGNALAFGTFKAVDQTVVSHELLYVLWYDDGDLEHLDTKTAEDAHARALASLVKKGPPKPLPKQLRRQDAEAHSATPSTSSGSRLPGVRALERREADAHLLNDQLWPTALLSGNEV